MLNALDFQYCEKLLTIIGQPANFLSSLAFVVVAIWLYWRDRCGYSALLPLIIGGTSLLWHGTGFEATKFLDVLVVAGVGLYLSYQVLASHYPAWSTKRLIMMVSGLLVSSLVMGLTLNPWLPQLSGAFIPLVLGLLWVRQYVAAVLLGLAIPTRAVDVVLCGALQTGTHWIWHILTALTIYVILSRYAASRL
jgi:hypothetical protein